MTSTNKIIAVSANPASSAAGSSVATWRDPVIEAYKKDVDRTLLRENLKLTVQQRFDKFQRVAEYARELRETGRRARAER